LLDLCLHSESTSVRSGEELINDRRLEELEEVSRAAREARNKIAKSLRLAKHAEDDIRSKYGSLRASMKKSKFLVSKFMPGSWLGMLSACGSLRLRVMLPCQGSG
jgi:hypothetical protein